MNIDMVVVNLRFGLAEGFLHHLLQVLIHLALSDSVGNVDDLRSHLSTNQGRIGNLRNLSIILSTPHHSESSLRLGNSA